MRTPTRVLDRALAAGLPMETGKRRLLAALAPGAVLARLRADWQGPRFYVGMLLVVAMSALVAVAVYTNHPEPELVGDTGSYLVVAQRILGRGQFMNAHRAPGYPTLIAVIFAVAGNGNLAAVKVAQVGLWLLAALETYTLAYLVLRRAWIACTVGLLTGANVTLLTYAVTPILSEGMTLFLLVTVALALALLLRSMRPRGVWLVAGCTLLLYLTRLEWVYAAGPLFGFVLLSASLRGRSHFRTLLPHAVGATVVLYALVGVYVLVNGAQTGYRGLTDVQNVNLMGKVMQYHMQNEAPPQYAAQAAIVNTYVAAGDFRVWTLFHDHPEFTTDHWALAGAYASAVVKAHPVEFLAKTVPLLWTTLAPYSEERPLDPAGPLAGPLNVTDQVFRQVHVSEIFFPAGVLLYAGLFIWRKSRSTVAVQAMGGVSLLAAYDLLITSLGSNDEYPRLHTPFEPLMLLLVWGTLLMGGYLAYLHWVRPGLRLLRRRWSARSGG